MESCWWGFSPSTLLPSHKGSRIFHSLINTLTLLLERQGKYKRKAALKLQVLVVQRIHSASETPDCKPSVSCAPARPSIGAENDTHSSSTENTQFQGVQPLAEVIEIWVSRLLGMWWRGFLRPRQKAIYACSGKIVTSLIKNKSPSLEKEQPTKSCEESNKIKAVVQYM